jgi:hypothetical protein
MWSFNFNINFTLFDENSTDYQHDVEEKLDSLPDFPEVDDTQIHKLPTINSSDTVFRSRIRDIKIEIT